MRIAFVVNDKTIKKTNQIHKTTFASSSKTLKANFDYLQGEKQGIGNLI